MQPDSDWDDLDWDLLSALDRAERDVSERTGLPWWLTRTGHPQVEIAVETTEDSAEAALDKWDDKHVGKKRRPGVHRYAKANGIEGFPTEGGLAREALLTYASEQNPPEEDDDLGSLIDRQRPADGYDASQYG